MRVRGIALTVRGVSMVWESRATGLTLSWYVCCLISVCGPGPLRAFSLASKLNAQCYDPKSAPNLLSNRRDIPESS